MISEIREYFKTAINEVDSSYKQHKEYFTSDNVSDANLEDTYFLKIGTMVNRRIDSDYQATFAVTIELWKNGRKDIINILDKAYCNAIEIMTKSEDQTRISQTESIKSIIGTTIEPDAVESNDNVAKYTLQFDVTVGYTVI
jgi:hypothetical protein